MARLLISCQGAARRISQSQEEALPFLDNVGLWVHLSACGHCRRYRKQVHELRVIFRAVAETSVSRLPEAAVVRIVTHLRERP